MQAFSCSNIQNMITGVTEGFEKKHKHIYVVEETPHKYRIEE